MPSGSTYKLKENKVQPKVELEDPPRVKLDKMECERLDVEYIETFDDQKEREFLYFKSLFPSTYYQWIDQVWRVLDERDGKEYLIYHAYQYCTQTVRAEDGKEVKRNHSIDGYYGFHHRPIVNVKEFNPDGSTASAEIVGTEKIYDIPWSKEAFNALIDDPSNKGTTNHFALGIASTDASRDVPKEKSTCSIRNREDFSLYPFDQTIKLAKSQLSTSDASMHQVQKILELRKRLVEESPKPDKTVTVKGKPEDSKSIATHQEPKP